MQIIETLSVLNIEMHAFKSSLSEHQYQVLKLAETSIVKLQEKQHVVSQY